MTILFSFVVYFIYSLRQPDRVGPNGWGPLEQGGIMSGIFGFIGRGNAFVEVRTGLENLSTEDKKVGVLSRVYETVPSRR